MPQVHTPSDLESFLDTYRPEEPRHIFKYIIEEVLLLYESTHKAKNYKLKVLISLVCGG